MTRRNPTALLAAVLTLHWFTRCEGAMRAEAGHAVWLSVLAAGLMLTVLCLILRPFLPAKGLLAVCRMRKGLRFFPLVTAMLFLLLSAGAWRNALASLSRTLLPETPRHVTVLLMLPAIAVMSRTGIVPVMRAVKLSAPLLLTLFAALLLAAAWGQAEIYRIFPLFGEGPGSLANAAGTALTAGAWLTLLFLEDEPVNGAKACLFGTLPGVTGYAVQALLLPLAARGWAQTLSALLLLPVQLAAVCAGLTCTARCLQSVLPAKQPRLWGYALLPPLALWAG